MKRIVAKSLLAVMLSLMMAVVFVPTIAFADDTVDHQYPKHEDASSAENDAAKYGGVIVNDIVYPEDWDYMQGSSVTFYRADPQVNGYYAVEPVQLEAGIVSIESPTFNGGLGTERATIGFFYDADCQKPVDGTATIGAVDGSDSYRYFKIPKADTFYLAFGASDSDWGEAAAMDISFDVAHYAMAKSGTTLQTGMVYAARSGKGKTTTFKYKPTYTGLLYIENDYGTKATLKKNSGKTIGAQANLYSSAEFGVKAKTKYKLSVYFSKSSASRGYAFYVGNDKIVNQSGSSKKKAKTLVQNEYKDGLIIAGSTKAKWFKFKLPEKNYFGAYFESDTNGKFRIDFYKGKKKLKKMTTYLSYDNDWCSVDSPEAMPAGTYYIKVTPLKKKSTFKKSSGWFCTKWEIKSLE